MSFELYGSNWMDTVITVQNSFESNYDRSSKGWQDSDNDGLDDDSEINIYNTDPNSDDSDGDGFKDGSEVLNNYNPNGGGIL